MSALHPGWRRIAAEYVGTAMLLTAVIGSGIMGERLSAGNAAVALLANTLATVFALYFLIECLAPVSGAHFNPLITILAVVRGRLARAEGAGYVLAQFIGAASGAVLANAMFELDPFQFAQKARGGWGQWLAEVVATGGLVLVAGLVRSGKAAAVVAAYIGSAYWFTSSTSFANPAAAFGRMFSDSFAGIAPASFAAFVASQAVGAVAGAVILAALGRQEPS